MAQILEIQLESLRQENSQFATVLQVTGVAASQATQQLRNPGCDGILIELVIANRASTGTMLPQVVSDDQLGNTFVLTALSVATGANGVYMYWVHPHVPAAAIKTALTDAAALLVPRNFHVACTYGGAGNVDLTVNVAFVK